MENWKSARIKCIATGCFIPAGEKGTRIGRDCLLGPNCTIVSSTRRFNSLDVILTIKVTIPREQGSEITCSLTPVQSSLTVLALGTASLLWQILWWLGTSPIILWYRGAHER